jgi:SAM-dependent methyltransferase
VTTEMREAAASFRAQYGAHRAAEGRGYRGEQLLALPYLAEGPHARQWAVRARTYEAFMRRVFVPLALRCGRPLQLADLGAGNGWLSRRVAMAGGQATAVDVRDDTVDGLGAAAAYQDTARGGGDFRRVVASFDRLPLAGASFDIALFNASLHYAVGLAPVLAEARRVVRPGGRIVILDSPFYGNDAAGRAMVQEKHREAEARFGTRAGALLAVPFIEYLTAERLAQASEGLGLSWRRHRVRYPLWYEMRGAVALLRGRRAPSRFDLWECQAT